MYYHVAITLKSKPNDVEYRIDIPEEELKRKFIEPYNIGQAIITHGKIIQLNDIERIHINRTPEKSEKYLIYLHAERVRQASQGIITTGKDEEYIIKKGDNVTDEYITGPPGHISDISRKSGAPRAAVNNAKVFVVHGRNMKIRNSMFLLLKEIGLEPIEWSEAREATGKPTPYVGEILDKAFNIAQAVVVLFTPDDIAKIKEEFLDEHDSMDEKHLTDQARLNVIFEAGMSMGRDPDRTIMVEIGRMRPFSDIGGRHVLKLDDSEHMRRELVNRLKTAGCPVKIQNDNWKTQGDFSIKNDMGKNNDAKKYIKTEDGTVFVIINGKASHVGSANILLKDGLSGTQDPRIEIIKSEELKKYL